VLDADVEVERRSFTVRASLSVEAGSRLALFGPSGAGKTTVLEAVAGLVPLRRGSVVLGGVDLTSLPPWRRRIGLLRQDPGLFPHLSVRDNLLYGRRTRGRAQRTPAPSAPPPVDSLTPSARSSGLVGVIGTLRAGAPAGPVADELAELAAVLGISELLTAMPARLSGGQAHRVALGRLLMAHCDALLLDEPYSGLDAVLRRSLTSLVVSLVRERSVPAVLVAHELSDAQAFADQLAVIDAGAVLQVGSPSAVVLRPASRRVASLVGYLGFVPVPSGSGVAGVHPERVVSGAFPSRGLVLSGDVAALRPSGAGWEADLRVGEALVTCRLPEPPSSGVGTVVTVLDPPYFDADGALLASVPSVAET
jgi:molybdate transport system ATP-binding protein